MEKEEGTQTCPCGNADQRITHMVVRECELLEGERNVLLIQVDMRKIDGRDMDKLGTLDSNEKTIDISGDTWWLQSFATVVCYRRPKTKEMKQEKNATYCNK